MVWNNSTIVENHRNVCIGALDNIQSASENAQHNVIIILGTVGTIAFVLNTILIWCIVKTKEWENQSSKLILIDSFYGLFGSLVISISSPVYITYNDIIPCPIKITMMAFQVFCVFIIAFFVTVIAFDRLMRVVYLQNYPTKFNTCKCNLVLVIHLLASVIQTIMWVIGILDDPGEGAKKTAPLNMPLSLFLHIYCRNLFDINCTIKMS